MPSTRGKRPGVRYASGSSLAALNGNLNPATRGALAGFAVGGAALVTAEALSRAQKAKTKNKAKSRKRITQAHAGRAGGAPSKTTKSAAKGRNKKTNWVKGPNGRFMGSR